MRVLVGCEASGVVRDAFRRRGIDAWSCDTLPAPGHHIRADLLTVLDEGWDLMIVHPPCTYLASSGLHWNHRVEGRAEQTRAALEFVRKLLAAPIDRVALENPVGRIGTEIREADQYIQPYDFGHDASKCTGVWLKNLPLLRPTCRVPGRWVEFEGRWWERWSNQTDSGQNRLSPDVRRQSLRAQTYQGIADAMADQWASRRARRKYTCIRRMSWV